MHSVEHYALNLPAYAKYDPAIVSEILIHHAAGLGIEARADITKPRIVPFTMYADLSAQTVVPDYNITQDISQGLDPADPTTLPTHIIRSLLLDQKNYADNHLLIAWASPSDLSRDRKEQRLTVYEAQLNEDLSFIKCYGISLATPDHDFLNIGQRLSANSTTPIQIFDKQTLCDTPFIVPNKTPAELLDQVCHLPNEAAWLASGDADAEFSNIYEKVAPEIDAQVQRVIAQGMLGLAFRNKQQEIKFGQGIELAVGRANGSGMDTQRSGCGGLYCKAPVENLFMTITASGELRVGGTLTQEIRCKCGEMYNIGEEMLVSQECRNCKKPFPGFAG